MVEVAAQVRCPACSTPLAGEGDSAGLCPGCLFELALDNTSLEAELLAEPGEAPTLQFAPDQTFAEGEIQGERYRIRSLLGRGGMGEVWRAYDLKLRQDVALKALRQDLLADRHALETLRQEVRVAREVISPNVCRVFDLQEVDGQELISMEYVDGTTLQEVLRDRGPLELNEAREIASQFLAGLEAIHEAGLIHRDIKPENLMITRTGRVVVMDFGIAKGLGDGKGGMVAGTPAYMSPEQARGSDLDARADLFSAGVVLAEMVEPGGVRNFEARRHVWEGLHRDSPGVTETPWAKVIAKSVSAETSERLESASALARALEKVTLRAAGDETARPYPGLSAFQEEDAEFFYGRELEVEALWKKLRRPQLLAVIGPSGAGKSSFLRAGLLPTLTDGWQAVITTPGNRPFANLARALAEQLPEDRPTVDALLRFEEPEVAVDLISQWRLGSKHGLVILDQFEELFTQNPEEVQQTFAELLGALPVKADVHVLLSMRDDFLYHCHRFEAFQPILSDLSLLGPPTGASMRRAIVEPALRCGYRFEEESIVEEMLTEVEGERGALPMVAFSASQLWEGRDRETGFLTRKAYERIGGVGGALAQHAESTLEQIGEDGIPIVRELFRNLVTAQGTRAARDREELLSIFDNGTESAGGSGSRNSVVGEGFTPSREGARPSPTTNRTDPEAGRFKEVTTPQDVLDTLINARLLTSYETPASDHDETPHHHIEIVHESLLANWPRLVRWRTQDAQGAQLRDELRAQAKLWNEHGRSEDYLWTGTAFKEYELWRERYPGGLTEFEEALGAAMVHLAERQRRRRRIAISAAFGILLVVLGVITWFGWQAEFERRRAEAETLRAEASKLLALAQLRFEEDPTEALAFTTASLGLDDTEQARLSALRILWEAPPALEAPPAESTSLRFPAFSPDGRSLSVAGHRENSWVWIGEGKETPVRIPGQLKTPRGHNVALWASNELLVTWHGSQDFVRIWRLPGGELVRTIEFGATAFWEVGIDRLFAWVVETGTRRAPEIVNLRSWLLPDGEPEELERVDLTVKGDQDSWFDLDGSGWWYLKGNEVFYRPLPVREGVPDRLMGSHENEAAYAQLPTESGRIWTRDKVTGELRLWSTSASKAEPVRVVERPLGTEVDTDVFIDPLGRWALAYLGEKQARLWDLEAWSEARPLTLRRRGSWRLALHAFHPSGEWLVVSTEGASRLTLWPLRAARPRVVDGYHHGAWRPLGFTPDGKSLATSWPDGSYRLWPLPGSKSREVTTVPHPPEGHALEEFAFDPQMRFLVGGGLNRTFSVVPLDGSPARRLGGFSGNTAATTAAVSPTGKQVAAAASYGEDKTLRVWNVETEDERVFDLPPGSPAAVESYRGRVNSVFFAEESVLYTSGDGGVRRWNLDTGTHELIYALKDRTAWAEFRPDSSRALVTIDPDETSNEEGRLELLDLETGIAREPEAFSWYESGGLASLGPSGDVIAMGGAEGIIRVGRLSDEEPHLLLGHDGPVQDVAISPDGQWIASTGEDNTLRLWPMPDLDKPPLHTLPHDELIAKLQSLTNIRVVRDPDSEEGSSVALDPFPGWAEVPTWQ